MRFEEQIQIRANKIKVWEFLQDVGRLAECIPGCQEMKEISPEKQYALVIEERIGPLRIHFELDIEVVELREAELMWLQVQGSDKKLAAKSKGELKLELLEGNSSNETTLVLIAELQLTGKIASLGQAIIKRKVHEVTQAFAQEIKARLENT